MKIEWVGGWMEIHSWECVYCLHLVQYFEKETVISKSNTLGEIYFLIEIQIESWLKTEQIFTLEL